MSHTAGMPALSTLLHAHAVLFVLSPLLQATLAVLDDITARIQMLSARPTGLDDFVNYMVSACISFVSSYVFACQCLQRLRLIFRAVLACAVSSGVHIGCCSLCAVHCA